MNRRSFLKAVAAVFGTVVAEPLAKALPADRLTYTYEIHPFVDTGDFTIEFWLKADHLSDIRITKGVARLTADLFTPPDHEWNHYRLVSRNNILSGYRNMERVPVGEVPIEVAEDIVIADTLKIEREGLL